jgi:uncharacterized protein (TIGR02246 family)
MRRTTWFTAIVLVAVSALASAQKPDPDATKLASEYEAAFNKADGKAIAALYTEEATRLGPDGQFTTGRAAIGKVYTDGFTNGPLKGAKLTLVQGSTHVVTPDVKVMEGTYSVAGTTPLKGRYVNTVVKKGAQWLLASVVTIPAPAAPAK